MEQAKAKVEKELDIIADEIKERELVVEKAEFELSKANYRYNQLLCSEEYTKLLKDQKEAAHKNDKEDNGLSVS